MEARVSEKERERERDPARWRRCNFRKCLNSSSICEQTEGKILANPFILLKGSRCSGHRYGVVLCVPLFGCQMHRSDMLTESRKRRRGCDAEEVQVLPQPKRSGGYSFLPEVGHDVWDSESSSSDSSGISSPEQMAGATSSIQKPDQRGLSPGIAAEEPAVSLSQNISYDYINRILREAHFSSLQTRGQQAPT
ncbi:protein FAM104A [Danio aesculapii]|uniref:protein FAM104A n=1 Tax=Danio aesculapii TaxID=1142201 RepID=UPI0024BF13E7|nr:protein FAM104A [Danio aesculapii]